MKTKPEKQHPSLKGEVPRRMWSTRLPVETIEKIQTQSARRRLSQSDVVARAIKNLR